MTDRVCAARRLRRQKINHEARFKSVEVLKFEVLKFCAHYNTSFKIQTLREPVLTIQLSFNIELLYSWAVWPRMLFRGRTQPAHATASRRLAYASQEHADSFVWVRARGLKKLMKNQTLKVLESKC